MRRRQRPAVSIEVPICPRCATKRSPSTDPTQRSAGAPRTCTFCGGPTDSGLYVTLSGRFDGRGA